MAYFLSMVSLIFAVAVAVGYLIHPFISIVRLRTLVKTRPTSA